MDSPEMIRTRGDGIDIQLALWSGEGRAILCVHGLTANCRCWDTMAASLVPRYKLIALDLRGRGLSGKPPERILCRAALSGHRGRHRELGHRAPGSHGTLAGCTDRVGLYRPSAGADVGPRADGRCRLSIGRAARECADGDQARLGQTRARLPVLRRVYCAIEAGPFSKPLVRGPGMLFSV